MIDRLLTDIAKPSSVIVGEPTSMRPIVAHKGIAALRTTVIGHEAHSSQVQRGVSAVMTAAKLITFIDGMMAENQAKADPHCSFRSEERRGGQECVSTGRYRGSPDH